MSMTRGPKRAAATRVLELLVNPAQHPGLEAAHTRVGGKPCPARLPGGTAAGTARLGHSRCSADSSHRVNGVVPLTWQRLPVTHTASSPRAPHRCGAHGSRGGVPARAWPCLHDRLWGRHGLTPVLQLGKLRPREAESS